MAISQDNRLLLSRLAFLRVGILVFFVGFGLKLWHLTVIRSDHYQELALKNQIRTVPLIAPRGAIFDREGRVLVENTTTSNVLLYHDEAEDLDVSKSFLIDRLVVDPGLLEERLKEAAHYGDYRPLLVKEALSMEELARVLSHQAEHPEFRVVDQPRRFYRYGSLAAHVLGFVGEVSPAEMEGEFSESKAGDIVGKSGIERYFNERLTGEDGFSRLLVNSYGKQLREVERAEPLQGQRLDLTLDLDLQRIAEEGIADRPGAVLAFDPRNGEVLVLASRPSFDPNIFASRITRQQWTELIENPDDPLQNRVTQSTFSPGSTFKIVMALAGLELGVVDETTSVFCNGAVYLYGHRFRCWRAGGHGRVRLEQAIQHSCNVYFYVLGQKVGIDEIANFSRRVGFGQPTGLKSSPKSLGIVPSPQWKRRNLGQPWYAGETISVAIGQGYISVTPAQMARAIGAVATGFLPELRITKDSSNQNTQSGASVGFSPENLEAVRNAMWKVVNETGTGRSARVPGFDVCGKTGTAQTISIRARERLSEEEQKKYEPNAWFVGFAPREDPEIAVAVIVQRGGSGGIGAGPIAGRLFAEYYQKSRKDGLSGLELAAK